MADKPPVKRQRGGQTKAEDKIRDLIRNQQYNKTEWEKVEWAAEELGLTTSSFVRMAALKLAKETIG